MRVPAHEAEIARARFVTFAPEGFEEAELGDELELAAYLDAEAETRLRAYFPSAEAVEVDPGWEDRWRTFHRGVRAAGLWIGPPWADPPPSVPVVVIEPARAFGTGAHPTTRACIELLARTARGSLVDAGCGSGVLSVAAARLGFGPIVALDVDEAAVEAARDNALRNGVEIDTRVTDVLDHPLPSAELLVANIELGVVESLLSRWTGPRAIASGYLAHEAPVVPGWSSDERCELDGWAAGRFVRLG